MEEANVKPMSVRGTEPGRRRTSPEEIVGIRVTHHSLGRRLWEDMRSITVGGEWEIIEGKGDSGKGERGIGGDLWSA